MKRVTTAFLILTFLILSSGFMQASMVDPNFCGAKCGVRCSKASAQKRCLKYCGICCQKCECVPSGTYGHKDECPCYRDLKNRKGGSKCP